MQHEIEGDGTVVIRIRININDEIEGRRMADSLLHRFDWMRNLAGHSAGGQQETKR